MGRIDYYLDGSFLLRPIKGAQGVEDDEMQEKCEF